MKKMIYLAVMLTGLVASAATPPEVNERVLKAFNETFSAAQDVVWKEFENKNCEASFKQTEITVRAMYDVDGNLLETVRTYSEKFLPPNIIARLKKRHAGKEIFTVTETTSDAQVSYYITLKDAKNWYVIQSDPYGNFQQLDKFKRGEGD